MSGGDTALLWIKQASNLRASAPPWSHPVPLTSRERGLDLVLAIKAGDESAALDILSRHPGSAWCRDDEDASGPYPVHLAVSKGLEQLVIALVSLPGESANHVRPDRREGKQEVRTVKRHRTYSLGGIFSKNLIK